MRFLTTIFFLFCSIVLLAQEVKKADIVSVEEPVIVSLQDKIRQQQTTIDSLILLIMEKEEQGSIVSDIDEAEKLDEDEVKLGKLALQMDQKLFEVLNGESKLDAVKKYFLPRFSANFVSIDKNGVGQIAIVTHENFGEHLDNYTDKKTSYKIVNIDFLDTKVAGDIFNMAYKTIVEVYVDGELNSIQSILTTLTGKRDDYNWRIGSYSSTSIAFEPEEE